MLHRLYYLRAMLLVVALPIPAAGGDVIVEVSAGKHDRINTPISLRLDESLKQQQHFTLTRLDTKQRIAAQVSGGEPRHLVWLLRDRLAAGTTRRYLLSAANTSPASKDGVLVEDDDEHLRITVAGKPVLVYNTAVIRSLNRDESYYDRSGHIHPLYNPRGQIITDDFAPDHPHQHGIMFAWTNTTFEGRPVNFWDQKSGKGKIEHTKTESLVLGPVFGGFTVGLRHLDVSTPDSPKVVLRETWRVTVYNLTDDFLFDLESIQQCVGNPLQIEEYHYGGFAIRGHRNWLTPGQGDFLTSEGKTRDNGNHTRPRWCDIHGTVEGQMTGVTIFCDRSNFRWPQPVRLHPQKPYFCFAPMVLGGFMLQAAEPYISRYRLRVHNGPLDRQATERCWQDLADPPRVRLLAAADRDE